MALPDRRVLGGTLWLSASFALGRGLALLTQIVLARLIAPSDFGLWAMVLVLTTLAQLFREATIAQVLVQRGIDDRRLVDSVYSLAVNVSVALCLLQALGGIPLSLFFGEPSLMPLAAAAALGFLFTTGAGTHSAVMQRQMRFRALALCDVAAAVGRLGGALAAAAAGLGVWAFVAGELAAAAIDGLLKRLLSGWHFHYQLIPDREALKEVGSFIVGIVSVNLAVQANTNGDNLMIGRLLGARDLGFYNLAYQLAMLPVFALSQINRVNFSALARLEADQRRAYALHTLELYGLLAAPIYALAFVVAPWLIPLVYGPAWSEAVPLFRTVLAFACARGFMAILGICLNAAGRPGVNAAINWALVPLSLPAYWLGATLAGSLGVAAAVALVMGGGATLAFGLAAARVLGWPLQCFLAPVLLPVSLAVAATLLALPLPLALQPFVLLAAYTAAVVLLRPGNPVQPLVSLALRRLRAPGHP
jgi:O-antigen/teichoic acid export membrane protein